MKKLLGLAAILTLIISVATVAVMTGGAAPAVAERPAQLTQPSLPYPPVIMEVLDPSLQQYAAAWQAEIGRRFPHAVGVLCHGGNFVGDQWIVTAKSFDHYLTAPDIARYEQAKYPDRTIVLLCCNPGHLRLGVPGVYYATDSVWTVPDRSVGDKPQDAGLTLRCCYKMAISRWAEDPSVVGNVFEFIED